MIGQVLLLFNIGGGELIFIVLVIIMFFGSDKIPELARTLGKGMKEIRNATNEIQQEIRESTKDITKVTDSLSVEKQVLNFVDRSTILEEVKSEDVKLDEPSSPSNTISQTETTLNSASKIV